MKKIAFLFLVIDNPNFPKIWNSYFRGHKDKYNIYIHPKFPDKLTWNKKYMINNLKETKWGFITNAYIELLKEAYKDEDNYKFIVISESCVPIQSFDNFYNDAINDTRSWIKIMKINNYYFSKINNHKKELKIYPSHFIKHYARFCLNRTHVKILLDKDKMGLLNFFHTMQVGDEFFLSVLYPLKNYKDFDVTFDDWEYVDQLKKKIKDDKRKLYEIQERDNIDLSKDLKILQNKFNNIAKNPKTIVDIDEDLEKIKNCKSYFYRKFSKECNIEEYWKKIIKFHEK